MKGEIIICRHKNTMVKGLITKEAEKKIFETLSFIERLDGDEPYYDDYCDLLNTQGSTHETIGVTCVDCHKTLFTMKIETTDFSKMLSAELEELEDRCLAAFELSKLNSK